MDYGFLGERAKDEKSEDEALVNFFGSHCVPVKGVGDGYAVQCVVRTLDEWVRTSVVLRSDGENSISELKRKIKAREEQTMIEAAPRGRRGITFPFRTQKGKREKKRGTRASHAQPSVTPHFRSPARFAWLHRQTGHFRRVR